MDTAILKVFLNYFLMVLCFTGVFLIFKYFIEIFLTKKTLKQKILKYVIVILMSSMCLFMYKCYYHDYDKQIHQMKENILYILPKSDTTKKN